MPLTSLIRQNHRLDRNYLQRVRENYLALNRFRLNYAREVFPKQHALYLDVLPALFHFNHPMLPGYSDRDTPSGLYNFTQNPEQQQQLKRLARSFRPTGQQQRQADILAIYTMGSLGSSAQNARSDIDIWLCYRPDLDQQGLQLLKRKSRLIERWARSMNIDTTIFLMNDRAFASGKRMKLDKESSGSTQHFLLLDEFYRTAILIGGQLPAWIYTSGEKGEDYQSTTRDLLYKRRVLDRQLVDFGDVPKIEPGECISAAIWNLYKAIESPYKAIIKLLLIQIYITRRDASEYLSAGFREWLHRIEPSETLTLAEYDPYLSIYQAIERYLLETGQRDRLDLLQRCFYFKIAHPRFKIRNTSLLEKQTVIDQLTQSWGWDEATLRHLDNRANWKIATVNNERRAIIDQLNYSYHFILDFFRQEHSDTDYSNREMNILGRKLHAAFSKKSGKIDWINPNISDNISEKSLLISNGRQKAWEATFNHEPGANHHRRRKTITKSSLIELLVWLHCNRIMTQQTRLHLDTTLTSIPLEKCRNIISELVPSPLKLAEHHHFQKSAALTKVVIFFHSFEIPDLFLSDTPNLTEQEYLDQYCSIDVISLNSWNEIRCESRQGTVTQLLCELFSSLFRVMQPDAKTHFYFFEEFIAQTLSAPLARLYKDMFDFYYQQQAGRYLLQSRGRFYLLSQHPELPTLEILDSEQSVFDSLANGLKQFSSLALDQTTLNKHELGLFGELNTAGAIQVFVEPRGNKADLVIADERGVFSRMTADYAHGIQSLSPLFMLLRTISQRLQSQHPGETNPLQINPISFYRIYFGDGRWHSEPLYPNNRSRSPGLLEISAVAEVHQDEIRFTLECEGHIFDEKHSGQMAYRQLGLLLQKNRTTPTGYSIRDLDISACQGNSSICESPATSDYLRVIDILDQKITTALPGVGV